MRWRGSRERSPIQNNPVPDTVSPMVGDVTTIPASALVHRPPTEDLVRDGNGINMKHLWKDFAATKPFHPEADRVAYAPPTLARDACVPVGVLRFLL